MPFNSTRCSLGNDRPEYVYHIHTLSRQYTAFITSQKYLTFIHDTFNTLCNPTTRSAILVTRSSTITMYSDIKGSFNCFTRTCWTGTDHEAVEGVGGDRRRLQVRRGDVEVQSFATSSLSCSCQAARQAALQTSNSEAA